MKRLYKHRIMGFKSDQRHTRNYRYYDYLYKGAQCYS